MRQARIFIAFATILLLQAMETAPSANAFPGFYVSKSGEKLMNSTSRVVIARDGDTTTLTMTQDYRGASDDFAIVVPVPEVITEDQVTTRSPELIKHLHAYTAPRLSEYNEPGACQLEFSAPPVVRKPKHAVDALSVMTETRFVAGIYDISILSAEESKDLVAWLRMNGYRLPRGAKKTLAPYIEAGMKFFVAHVALPKVSGERAVFLPPLQIRFQNAKFTLPFRLGTLNGFGHQELVIYMLARHGRVAAVNYKNHEFPSNQALPSFIRDKIGEFYRSLIKRTVIQRGKPAVFTEYAWQLNDCAPCAAPPLSRQELGQLGAGWMMSENTTPQERSTFVTRFHLRYERADFEEDLEFVETDGATRYQARYIVTHQAPEDTSCPPDEDFRAERDAGRLREAKNLARLTGWPLSEILNRIGLMR